MSTLEATILSLALLEGLDPNTAQQSLIDLGRECGAQS
jgi:hypothetical protein